MKKSIGWSAAVAVLTCALSSAPPAHSENTLDRDWPGRRPNGIYGGRRRRRGKCRQAVDRRTKR